VRDAEFLNSCNRDTDDDGDCGHRNCECKRIRHNAEPERVVPEAKCYCRKPVSECSPLGGCRHPDARKFNYGSFSDG
jgi:hypothetical protein